MQSGLAAGLNSGSMSLTVLITMAGTICLLLWGSYSVRTAVEQGYAAALNKLVSMASRSKIQAVIGGAIAAMLMQSATATILLCTGLISSGVLSQGAAMSVILGADLGSAIAARILFIDLSILPPLLLLVGMLLNLLSNSWRWRQLGRILIGLGLMLLSIQWMKQTIAPMAATPLPSEWLSVMQSVPWFGMIMFALITWFAHSSVAMVLVIAALAETGLMPIAVCIPMLLGANIGAGLISVPLVDQDNIEARSVVLSNVLLRTTLAIILLLGMNFWMPFVANIAQTNGEQIIFLHISFNGLLLVLTISFAGRVAHKVAGWLRQRNAGQAALLMEAAGAGLDSTEVSNPDQAIASARREAYRMGDLTETMFAQSLGMFAATDRSQILQLVDADKEINLRNKAIHTFLSEVRRHITNPKDEQYLDQVLQFSSTMENIGDCISHDLARLAIKKLDRGVTFSDAGYREIVEIHGEVLKLMKQQINYFAGSVEAQNQQTLSALRQIKKLCYLSVSRHRRRLSQQLASSMVTSSIHQDTIRDFLQIAVLLEPEVVG